MTPFTHIDELGGLLAASWEKPVLIFKHSSTCGVSAMAEEELIGWLDATSSEAAVYVIDVRSSRSVAHAVAERLKVRHESPQVLLIRDGSVRWHRSHYGVTVRAIEDALAKS